MKIILLLFSILFLPEPSSAALEDASTEAARMKALNTERFYRGKEADAIRSLREAGHRRKSGGRRKSRDPERRASTGSMVGDSWKARQRAERKARLARRDSEEARTTISEPEEDEREDLLLALRTARAARSSAHREALAEEAARRARDERERARSAQADRVRENTPYRDNVARFIARVGRSPFHIPIVYRAGETVENIMARHRYTQEQAESFLRMRAIGVEPSVARSVVTLPCLETIFTRGLVDSDGTSVVSASELRSFMAINYSTMTREVVNYVESAAFRSFIKGKSKDFALTLLLAKTEEDSVVRIQSIFRGYSARRAAAPAPDEAPEEDSDSE